MNTFLPRRYLRLGLVVASVCTPIIIRGADPAQPTTKDHALFIGLNLFVQRDDASNPVV